MIIYNIVVLVIELISSLVSVKVASIVIGLLGVVIGFICSLASFKAHTDKVVEKERR